MSDHQPLLGPPQQEPDTMETIVDMTVGGLDEKTPTTSSSSSLPQPLPPPPIAPLPPPPAYPDPTRPLPPPFASDSTSSLPQSFSNPAGPLPPPLFNLTTPFPPRFIPDCPSSLPPPLSVPISTTPNPHIPPPHLPSYAGTPVSQGGGGGPLPPLPDYLLSTPPPSSDPFMTPPNNILLTPTLSTHEREKGQLYSSSEEKTLSTVERKRMKERRTTITRTYERTREREKAKQKQRSANRKELLWAQMEELKTLYEQGFLTEQEFEERKSQVIDELTGTKKGGSSSRTPKKRKKKVVHHDDGIEQPSRPPPDFNEIQPEEAIKHIFDPHVRSWSQHPCQVRVDSEPFAKGTLRKAYYLQMEESRRRTFSVTSMRTPTKKSEKQKARFYVAKMAIDPFEDRDTYFKDVETQMYAKEWAERFNLYNPPKKVGFIACSVLELVERPGKPICGVERFIEGNYKKHNNNIGFVSDAERNTPQAFSHFTYHASGKNIVICDIQGVGDLYTDPQIHTIANLKGIETVFGGKGNLGVRGLERFIESHRCNPICQYLRLPPVGGDEEDEGAQGGTLPATPYMDYQKVEVVLVQIKDATEVPTVKGEEKRPLLPNEQDQQYGCMCTCSIL